jgi:hypothetical protein
MRAKYIHEQPDAGKYIRTFKGVFLMTANNAIGEQLKEQLKEQPHAQSQIFQADVKLILSHRYDLGGEYWTTPDKRLIKGTPFSAYNCAMILLELGVPTDDPVLTGVAELFFGAWREDGRFKLYPSGAIYPCHTAIGVRLLCALGYADDERVRRSLTHLLETRHSDGGWRCKKFSFGHGPETETSNPMPTLTALDAFRYTGYLNDEQSLNQAVEFLLNHWTVREPIGPCHYGIGTLFMQVEYPFGDYNLFQYVYVLSFYSYARNDPRFIEAYEALKGKLVNGKIIVERNSPRLSKLSFCKKGQPSALATKRWNEIEFMINKCR